MSEPTTAAGRALLKREALNARPFPIVTAEMILAIEDEARRTAPLDVERLARAACIEAESIESHPTDWDDCPDRDGHREYAAAIAREYGALALADREEK